MFAVCGARAKPVNKNAYQSELVCGANASWGDPGVLKRLSVDTALGVFDVMMLDSVWFYDGHLEAARIRATSQPHRLLVDGLNLNSRAGPEQERQRTRPRCSA